MALTPIDYVVNDAETTQSDAQQQTQVSRTWRIDLDSGRLGGVIDGESAIRQYIRKALMTPRNRYLIYDDQYGEGITDLIGHNLTPALAQVEIPRLVREAIIYDDRIAEVPSVTVEQHGKDGVHVIVEVVTVDGTLVTEEVTL